MHLTVLGCRSGMPANGQASSGYLAESGATRLLLDCGPGIATALSAILSPGQLDGVVISHLHMDHCYDILPVGKSMLTGRMEYPTGGKTVLLPPMDRVDPDAPPVPLYVPAGARDVLDRLAALFPFRTSPIMDKAFEVAFEVHEYEPGEKFRIGDCEISLTGLVHALPNCGVRVESPSGSLAYTGDTGVTDELIDLARGVDLLIAEATLGSTDHGPHGHLSAGDAARAAQAAGVGQLLLTHFVSVDPNWLETLHADAVSAFSGPVTLATPGTRVEVRSHRTALR